VDVHASACCLAIRCVPVWQCEQGLKIRVRFRRMVAAMNSPPQLWQYSQSKLGDASLMVWLSVSEFCYGNDFN